MFLIKQCEHNIRPLVAVDYQSEQTCLLDAYDLGKFKTMDDFESDEPPRTYNTELISVIYNTELKEHLTDLKQLKTNLSEVTSIFRQGARDIDQNEKPDKIKEMKEYIEQALANLVYSTTHATQKVKLQYNLYLNIIFCL